MGEWKLIRYFESNVSVLYNLGSDIGETSDVSASHPDIARKLGMTLNHWIHRTNAPIPSAVNDKFKYSATLDAAVPFIG